ncbi:GNAT family N-acetyltransferase [Roseomonas sp. BN140053]|uniref:GNAT family N-acetyltransferase n=1 Tax=Roseomonas sp. BN140053 TaxID=3391898 RepID=UPI0039E7E569
MLRHPFPPLDLAAMTAVPPPPSIATLERAALTAVPAPRLAWDGGFVVRGFRGGTGRANAACCLDPAPDPELPARVARIEADFARWNLVPRFRSTPLDPPGLVPLLLARGYAEAEGARVMAGPLDGLSGVSPLGEHLDGPAEDWLAVLGTAEYQTPARRAEKAAALPLLARPATWLLHRAEGVPAASAQAIADASLCGIFDVATDPRFRRRGLARGVLAAIAQWGAAQGADTAWLQVATGNTGAQRLYEALGLREIYRYRYFLRP